MVARFSWWRRIKVVIYVTSVEGRWEASNQPQQVPSGFPNHCFRLLVASQTYASGLLQSIRLSAAIFPAIQEHQNCWHRCL
jgi:hypothetical protein